MSDIEDGGRVEENKSEDIKKKLIEREKRRKHVRGGGGLRIFYRRKIEDK